MGLSTLAAALAEEQDALEEIYEPFLIQIGFLDRTPRGRVATRMAYDHFGIKYGRQPGAFSTPIKQIHEGNTWIPNLLNISAIARAQACKSIFKHGPSHFATLGVNFSCPDESKTSDNLSLRPRKIDVAKCVFKEFFISKISPARWR